MTSETQGHTPTEVFYRATHPQQYDIVPTGWDGHGETSESTARIAYYLKYLTPFMQNLEGKHVLDIGAGTGWLVDHTANLGAASAVGVEPAGTNIAIGRSIYPNATLVQASFEDYVPDGDFDTVFSVMAFGHIGNLLGAFSKIKGLLKQAPESEVVLIVPEYSYFKTQRNGYKEVVVFDMSPDVAFTMTIKQDGSSLADIVRQPGVFHYAANEVGFKSTHDIPMPPSEEYMEAVPRYQDNRGVPMTRLLRYSL